MVGQQVLRIAAVFILSESKGGGRKHRRRVWFGEVDDGFDFGVLVRHTGEIKCESGP